MCITNRLLPAHKLESRVEYILDCRLNRLVEEEGQGGNGCETETYGAESAECNVFRVLESAT